MTSLARILFVAPSAYPLGGVAVWLDYLVRGLPAHGWDPVVGLVSGRWHDLKRYIAAYPGLPWIAIANPTGSAEGRRRAIAAAIRKQTPDMVVGVNIADVYSACRTLRESGSRSFRSVMALHGIAADLLDDLERDRHAVDGVIVTNRLTGVLCSELAGMAPERVHYAPYGVKVGAGAAERMKRRTGPLRIVYVGRLDDDQKRVGTIPEILRALDEGGVHYRLDVVGEGPMSDWLGEALAPWIADGRAVMSGPVPPETLSERVYARADALLVTSSWETGPIVIWEAMAAGVPVVTTRYVGSGLEGALEHDGNCLMFPVGDAWEAARQLGRLTDFDIAGRLAAKARRLVAERYSIESSVRAWAEALDSVAAAAPVTADVPLSAPRAAGRLDHLFGARMAETLRRSLGISFAHHSAGGEWPHSLGSGVGGDRFLEIVARLDGL